MDAYQRDFGRRIRHLRQQMGCSQEELAFRAGIHVTYLSGIERGVRNPSLKNIRAIAAALGAPVTALFAFENAPPPRYWLIGSGSGGLGRVVKLTRRDGVSRDLTPGCSHPGRISLR